MEIICSLHNGYCKRQGETSSIAEICSNLLSKDRDPPATPQEAVTEIPKFSEVYILTIAVSLSQDVKLGAVVRGKSATLGRRTCSLIGLVA